MITLEEAMKLHGHLGPFLCIGYRAGLHATTALGSDPFTIKCVARVPLKRPYSCALDGIQAASGCTIGKGNLILEDAEDFSFGFQRSDGKELTMHVKREIVRMALEASDLERTAREIMGMPLEKIFSVTCG